MGREGGRRRVRLKKQDTAAGGHLTIAGDADGNTGGVAWKQGQKYGRWEARMRVDQKSGGGDAYHPVLILWSDSDKWPDDGELDYAVEWTPGHIAGYVRHVIPVRRDW